VASQKSAQYPVQWADGSWHSKPQDTRAAQQAARDQQTTYVTGVAQQAAANRPAPQPYDPAAAATALSAGRNVALGNNEATYQTQQTGYDLGYNPDGTSNAANPYSQAQLLQNSYHRQQLGTTNSMAAQGQLYSGSTLNARAADDRGYSQGDAALRQQALERYHSIGATRAANYAGNASGVSDADWQALLKATYGG
jgi:hypothetical protein